MLSPNATMLATPMVCDFTATDVWHTALRLIASVAVQLTVVVPMGNVDPDAGVHATDTGGVPPVGVGAANVTGSDVDPTGTVAVVLAGHVTDSCCTGGGGGGDVGLPHDATAAAVAAAATRARLLIECRVTEI